MPYVTDAFQRILGFSPSASPSVSPRPTLAARDRAGEAFDSLLNEHSISMLDPQTAAQLVAAGNHVMLGADLLDYIAAQRGYRGSMCPDGSEVVFGQVQIMTAGFLRLSDELARGRVLPAGDRVAIDTLRGAALDCLRRWRNNDQTGPGTLAVVIAGEWVANLNRLERSLEKPVALAAEASRVPWWR